MTHRRHRLNYVYFGALFVLLALLHVFHVLLITKGTSANYVFYSIYAAGQLLVEVSLLVLIGAWVAEKFPVIGMKLFIVGTFVLLLIHLIDFPLIRIMDMTIWYSFGLVFAESFENFIEMLKASSVQLMTWILLGVGIATAALLGILLFRLADRLSIKKPLHFSYKTALTFTCSVMLLLIILPRVAAKKDEKFLQVLPWKTTFFPATYPKWALNGSFAQGPTEAWHLKNLEALEEKPLSLPNIYLFISESIRDDFITPETAPTLSQLSCSSAISGANATHYSWFSIFHGVYPFAWEDRQPKQWSSGSLPLQMLKKAGYQIHVLSASRLRFYQMDHMLFGKNHQLADEFQVFADQGDEESHVHDAQCVDRLIHQMRTAEQGHLFIVFFEGTHFDYSWPPHLTLPSRPVAQGIDYIQATYSQADLEGIKNRYRHAIYHVDQQFNRFLTALQSHPRQEEAVVVFTSDHGEEFFEDDRLFHASNLNRAQTRVPLYYRLPSQKALPALTSHLDIFPTLLDHVMGTTKPWAAWFDGESILRPKQKSFAVTTRFNGSRTPYEFLITTEDELLLARFDKKNDIRNSKFLEIVSRKTNR